MTPPTASLSEIELIDLSPASDNIAAEVHAGLSAAPQKTLPCKLFYDARGSELFDQITELPEYYPTRTEVSIFRQRADEMAQAVGEDTLVIELGSGSSTKTHRVLDALDEPAGYVPLDICREHLLAASKRLAEQYRDMPILPICADYTNGFEMPDDLPPHGQRLAFFPGSTIGNFPPDEALAFLKRIAGWIGDGGQLLIGVDTHKDQDVLEAAYNDAQGVTAEFNLNALAHLNQKLNSDFHLPYWRHRAHFNEEVNCIEMHLISQTEQQANVLGEQYSFAAGETIHTESSYKYRPESFQDLASQAGFASKAVWTDPDQMFSVHLLEVA